MRYGLQTPLYMYLNLLVVDLWLPLTIHIHLLVRYVTQYSGKFTEKHPEPFPVLGHYKCKDLWFCFLFNITESYYLVRAVHSPEEVASSPRIPCWVMFFHYLSLASLNG